MEQYSRNVTSRLLGGGATAVSPTALSFAGLETAGCSAASLAAAASPPESVWNWARVAMKFLEQNETLFLESKKNYVNRPVEMHGLVEREQDAVSGLHLLDPVRTLLGDEHVANHGGDGTQPAGARLI